MAAKYFVWGEGVWREVDVASGRVSGWRRRARFVFVRRGRLAVARRRPVLRALEALAAGQPSAAADGPRLAHRSKSESRTKRKYETPAVPAGPPPPAVAPPACEHHHCCVHKCNNNAERPARRSIATQCAPAGPAALTFSVQQTHSAAAPDYSSAEEFVSTSAGVAARTNTGVKELFGSAPPTAPPAAADKSAPVTTHAADERRERARKRARIVASDNTESTSPDAPLRATARAPAAAACKELLISDADVALLRSYVSRTNASALRRFDMDDSYKRLLFYAINPLVHLARCERLECLLRTASLGLVPAPARGLVPAPARGLVPAPARRPSASADTDKENKDRHSSPNKVREPAGAAKKAPGQRAAGEPAPPARLGVSARSNKLAQVAGMKAPSRSGGAGDPPAAKPERSSRQAALAPAAGSRPPPPPPPGAHVISKRASQPSAKEYSNLEDHAIVAWLGAGSRASLVGGNRVWRELQEQYERLTGRVRSWHSLRNRYLRYILPSLGALQLPPADVSRLRAAAATGAIKTKNRLAVRRHSAYQTPARGASSRRPQGGASSDAAAAADDDAAGPSSPKRASLRPRPPDPASKDTSNKDESGDESASKAGASKAAARSPRYSEVTRRFAARRRPAASSSSRSPSPAPVAPAARSRRLFNPNANV